MPPRGRRNNRQGAAAAGAAAAAAAPAGPAAAGGAGQAGAGGEGAPVQPPPFPLFQDGRSFHQLQSRITNLEIVKAEQTSRRKLNNLILNVWDMCGAKRTHRVATGGVPSDVKRNILEFMGDEKSSDFANLNPKWNAKRMHTLALQEKRRRAEKIIDNLVRICEWSARESGNLSSYISWNDAIAGSDVQGPADFRTFESGDKNVWEWTLDFYLPCLKSMISDAGFAFRVITSNPNAETEEDKRCGRKAELMIEWKF
ncbi:unnamed protein product [Amoebophrya sp. A25]|nr:unnamed protein product [Amoebophrya sp. A25]|eukprot:GSA25T00004375001.1